MFSEKFLKKFCFWGEKWWKKERKKGRKGRERGTFLVFFGNLWGKSFSLEKRRKRRKRRKKMKKMENEKKGKCFCSWIVGVNEYGFYSL